MTGIAGATMLVAYGPRSDLVDGNELRIESRHVAWVALVVVIDKLDRPAEESALGVHIVAPEFQRHQNLLAIRRDPAGE
jgi:hypothetical protein